MQTLSISCTAYKEKPELTDLYGVVEKLFAAVFAREFALGAFRQIVLG